MPHRVFTLVIEGEDDSALQEFLTDLNVVDIKTSSAVDAMGKKLLTSVLIIYEVYGPKEDAIGVFEWSKYGTT